MADSLHHLADTGTLSPLCAHVLQATLAVGRNVLFTGPRDACLPMMTAMVAQSAAPGIFSAALHAPSQDPMDLSAEPCAMAAWHLSPQQLAVAMGTHTGVVGHIRAHRLDRALMRFELAAGGGPSAALHVLASLDVVVVVGHDVLGHPQVTHVCEVRMAAEGYRPVPLFTIGVQPLVEVLVPCGLPAFLPELMRAQPGPWWAELRAAAGVGPAPTAPPEADAAASEAVHAPPRSPPTPPARRPRIPAPPPSSPAAAPLGSAPGWELDRLAPEADALGAADFASTLAGQQARAPHHDDTDDDDDDLAATYGLEPPPRPKS